MPCRFILVNQSFVSVTVKDAGYVRERSLCALLITRFDRRYRSFDGSSHRAAF